MSQELEEMKEMQDKESWKTVEKKIKLQHQSCQERRGAKKLETKKENYGSDRPIWSQ